jgi:uncharacterized protein YyaL (SSP411 family)
VGEHTNRLMHETSPYLRQHAHNPVDWYPWGEEAFARARRENRPVLLSVGYSACHWCHVMERESFEDEDTARLMNEHFVSIKVDREERPDVDHIYMNAVQMLTGRGGWPMTVFLTPDGKPFYGGTYFPPEDRHGMPSFRRVLVAVAQAYRDKREGVRSTVAQIMSRLEQLDGARSAAQPLGADLVQHAAAALAHSYDQTYGGLGQAPKFPNEAVFELFLRAYCNGGQRRYLEMGLHTLRQMAHGGIYDQLGGGFHRYAVDERWLVPHFEKMLYDNAQLVPLYLAAYQLSGARFFADIARDTLGYVCREMRDPAGGFYSAQDADSEGAEGKFFLWETNEVRRILGDEAADIACRYWDISEAGNFEGANILHVTLELEQLATMFRRDVADLRQVLADSRAKLFAARERRVKPALDDKVLTAWNALMISALAKAEEVLNDRRWGTVAVEAVTFIERNLQRGDRLLSVYRHGAAKLNGYLDDYAFFVQALIDVFEMTQDRRYLDHAVVLADAMIAHFWDPRCAGFYFTSDDHETLIVRSKPAFDGSIPSGNSVAAHDLLRLYQHTERPAYVECAEALLRSYAERMREQPFGFANMLCGVDFYVRKPREIVLVGHREAPETEALLRRIRERYIPNRTLTVIDPTQGEQLPPRLRGKAQIDGKPTVYVCHGMTCSAPVTAWDELGPLLHGETSQQDSG